MFNSNFYPTPSAVIYQMMEGENITGKTILEPSAGKGDIIDYLLSNGAASVIACENNEDLRKIVSSKCSLVGSDFLQLESHSISHIDYIVMNPPFNADEKHILHAYNIAPPSCKIIALCNLSTIENRYYSDRKELKSIIDSFGSYTDLGNCFAEAERSTGVEVALVKIQKAGNNYNTEFDGFFTDEEPNEQGEIGIMSYNAVRDLVNRYIGAIKIFDEQMETAVRLNDLMQGYFRGGKPELSITVTSNTVPIKRNEFKKEMQKSGWTYIFDKLDMKKHTTRGLKEDINKFVEKQEHIPFTMKNIYHMLDMVFQTTGQRMDKAILEVFDKLTLHHADNRFNVHGWKTNSHFLVNKRFIFPYMVEAKWYSKESNEMTMRYNSGETFQDLEKALCYISGDNYDNITGIYKDADGKLFGEWHESHFFKFKGFKKGTIHCEFKDENVWAKFNQRVAKLKGYPLFEGKTQTKYQDRQTGRAQQQKSNPAHAYKPTVLFEIKVA